MNTVVAIPFRVGWGFSREPEVRVAPKDKESQSLSGWDGVFHWKQKTAAPVVGYLVAIPFRVGWGFSHPGVTKEELVVRYVAIPFRVGWGFSLKVRPEPGNKGSRRNPFQGGMGFFTCQNSS